MNALSKKNPKRATHARFVATKCHLKHMRPKAAYFVEPTPSPWSARSLMMCVTESEDDLQLSPRFPFHLRKVDL